jgi:hypothetical protein
MNKILSLEIFDATIFEGDAVDWLAKCKEQKREWILKHTSQTNEEAINEFINNPNISKDCKCLDCGKNKKDVTTRISEEITATAEPINLTGNSKQNSVKRPKKAERGKN